MTVFYMKVRCPHCGHVTKAVQGVEEVACERCGYKITIHYKLEKIEGDPVSFLLKRASSDNNESKGEIECKKQ